MFQQLKEALDQPIKMDVRQGLAGLESRYFNVVVEAAMSYQALLQECDQCGGSGHPKILNKARIVLGTPLIGDAGVRCPSCSGRGMVVSDQAVEKGAEAMYEADDTYRDTWESQPEAGVKDWYRGMARAVLAAVIFGEET